MATRGILRWILHWWETVYGIAKVAVSDELVTAVVVADGALTHTAIADAPLTLVVVEDDP